jgi:rhodanese-related sulfurtransferase
MIDQLPPSDFLDWLQRAAPGSSTARPLVLDVREPWELQTASVREEGFDLLHIPMREVPARIEDLKSAHGLAHPIAVLCHHGMRSQHTANFLAANGFTHIVNVAGGIDEWSRQRDSSVPIY